MATWPRELFGSLCWSCGKKRWESAEAFSEAVREYQIAIREEDTWRPDEVVLKSEVVRVSFMCWNAEGTEQPEPVLELRSASPEGFTALDLFFKLCDGMAAFMTDHNMDLFDHCFFEGLSAGKSGAIPFYYVRFGS